MSPKQLAGRSAVVTGSTSGIGRAIAQALAREGANVMLNGFGEPAAIEALRAGLAKEHGVKASYHGADMAKPAEIRALVAKAEADFGAVDILVNNAGIQHVASIDQFPEDRWDAIIAINLSSAFHATKAVLPGMKRRRTGRIVNIASAHGLVASPNKSAYVAAKHGIVGFTKAAALETAEEGIRVNAVCPGDTETPMEYEDARNQGMTWDDYLAFANDGRPIPRMGEPDEIARAVLYLASDESSFVTGVALPVDGGGVAG